MCVCVFVCGFMCVCACLRDGEDVVGERKCMLYEGHVGCVQPPHQCQWQTRAVCSRCARQVHACATQAVRPGGRGTSLAHYRHTTGLPQLPQTVVGGGAASLTHRCLQLELQSRPQHLYRGDVRAQLDRSPLRRSSSRTTHTGRLGLRSYHTKYMTKGYNIRTHSAPFLTSVFKWVGVHLWCSGEI